VVALCPLGAQAREWLFDVTLDGIGIGTHRFVLSDDGATQHLTSDAHFRVRLLVFDAYRYDHHADETWRAGCLASLDSTTTERGKTTTVKGRLDADGFVIESARGRANAGACAMTFAYWNPRIFVQHALVNPQTGVATPVSIRPLGRSEVRTQGHVEEASGYGIDTDKTRIEAWYSSAGDWIGVRSTTHEGHVLDYRLRQERHE
jgi:hypothetical protein